MTIQTVLPVDRNSIETLSKELREPDWMISLRQQALEAAQQLELPKLEKTRIERWATEDYGTYSTDARVSEISELPDQLRSMLQEDVQSQTIVQHNSAVVFRSLPEELSQQGVIFTDLSTALTEHSELVQKHFMQAVALDENKVTALHTAAWSGGVFLYVPKNVEVDIPFHALFYTGDSAAVFAPHVLIIAEANSKVTYVDHYAGGQSDGKLVHNGIVEVFAKPGAYVQFCSVHDLGHSVTNLCYRRAVLEADARIDWVIGEMNQGDSMSDTTSVLRGNGSSSDARVICVGTGEQKLNITTRAIHFGKSSNSDMSTRAVMRDSSTAIINGITKIEKGATHCNGEQTERILMLSPTARGDANPLLLIDEDEVTAGHAASVGQVNQEQVHYLMSRGISREEATKLIIYGFLAPIVSEIPIATLEEQLKAVVERKLGQ